MSKTVSTCILETNQIQNKPQENVFFHTLYRTKDDFPDEFLRTAKSTSPIQICALFSCMGPDNLGAMLNINLNTELEKLVAQAQKSPVLDYEEFTNRVVNILNVTVCNFVVSHGGTPLKVSMTMLIIEGDTLRVVHLGNTKAVLIRDNKIMALTEEQTVAHRYVQMGAITAEQEKTHPDNMKLTQYLGKLPQDGPVVADKKVHLKLKDNDELCLMGLGISRQMPAQMRNMILVKPEPTETKAREIINSAFNYGVKSGLSIVVFKIESTFLLPGDAVINNNLASEGAVAAAAAAEPKKSYTPLNEPFDNDPTSNPVDDDMSDTINFNPGMLDEEDAKKGDKKPATASKGGNKSKIDDKKAVKKAKIFNVVIPVMIFVICILLGFGGAMLLANMKGMVDLGSKKNSNIEDEIEVYYVLNDHTPLYAEASSDSDLVTELVRGQAVAVIEKGDTFSNINTADGNSGYVYTVQLSEEDPTINDDIPVMETELTPTPVPTEPVETTGESDITESTLYVPQIPEDNTPSTTASTEAVIVYETQATQAVETAAETTPVETAETTPADQTQASETEATEPQSSDTTPSDTASTESAPSETAGESAAGVEQTTPSETAADTSAENQAA